MNFLLPNLRRLSFSGQHFNWSDVANMLASRWSAPTTRDPRGNWPVQLHRISINTDRENLINEQAKAVMQDLIAEGMTIRTYPFLRSVVVEGWTKMGSSHVELVIGNGERDRTADLLGSNTMILGVGWSNT
jgi:hypothetical protein